MGCVYFDRAPLSFSDLSFLVAAIDLGRCLPPASFRFHLTMDTLAFDYAIPAIRACSGLSTVRQCSLCVNRLQKGNNCVFYGNKRQKAIGGSQF